MFQIRFYLCEIQSKRFRGERLRDLLGGYRGRHSSNQQKINSREMKSCSVSREDNSSKSSYKLSKALDSWDVYVDSFTIQGCGVSSLRKYVLINICHDMKSGTTMKTHILISRYSERGPPIGTHCLGPFSYSEAGLSDENNSQKAHVTNTSDGNSPGSTSSARVLRKVQKVVVILRTDAVSSRTGDETRARQLLSPRYISKYLDRSYLRAFQ
ncbi:unnamed protein product [Timema podura]|uniref:Uncharacterized protein n=1 Tax=Timema podura TaxID=61482 RepID=A0ABN7NPA6_TIMPD|nr:unnamed protein product [Timema podura]